MNKSMLLAVMALTLLTACNEDQSYADRLNNERNAVNAPIQGTAADIIKMAMVAIHRRLKQLQRDNLQMIMQVHDELNFNVPADCVTQVRDIVVTEMQNVTQLAVPLIAECGVGNNWLEAH